MANKIHDVKLSLLHFNDVESGEKKFEFRINDRDYRVGDTILFREFWDGDYTGRTTKKNIVYFSAPNVVGFPFGFCILGIEAAE